MNKVYILILGCILTNSMAHSMEYWCPNVGESIDKDQVLNHSRNTYWKELSESNDQDCKDTKLKEALDVYEDPFEDCDSYEFVKRPLIICALAAGADSEVRGTEATALNFALMKNDGCLLNFVRSCGGPRDQTTTCIMIAQDMDEN